jgi:hypothetical protein
MIAMIEELGEGTEILLLEPRDVYDAMIVGVVERFHDTFVVYDKAAVFAHLEQDFVQGGWVLGEDVLGAAEEAAADWYSFNMIGGWHGPGTWGFLSTEVLGSFYLPDFPEPEAPSGGPD